MLKIKNFWNKLLILLKIRKPKSEEWDEDHALDMVINSIINELSEEEKEEIMNSKN